MTLSSFLCLFLTAIITSQVLPRPNRPHILLFVMDDVGWTDVSFHDGTGFITPNIDKYALDGIILDRYYVQPVCSPSRSALLQGLYPFHTGMQHFNTIKPASTAHMPLDKPTLAELLNDQNYSSHAIGKWHLGYSKWDYTPTERGFSSHIGFYGGMEDYFTKNFSIPSDYWPFPYNGYDWWRNKTVGFNDNGTHNLELFDAEMSRVLKDYTSKYKTQTAQRQTPLFIYMAHQIVHIPLQTPHNYLTNQTCSNVSDPIRNTYCTMMTALDISLGWTVDLFKSLNLWNDTLLIVTTDNGGIPDYGEFPQSSGCNYPLRAGKGSVFEGGVRAIGFVNGGANVLPSNVRGTNISSLVHIVDWVPTILAMVTNPDKLHTNITLDGYDIWDVLVNGDPGKRNSIPLDINYNVSFPNSGVRLGVLKGYWKLMRRQIKGKTLNYDGWYPVPPLSPIPPPQPREDGWFLFNLREDPNEHSNVYDQYPDKVQELKTLLESYVDYQHPQPNGFDFKAIPSLHNGTWAPWQT